MTSSGLCQERVQERSKRGMRPGPDCAECRVADRRRPWDRTDVVTYCSGRGAHQCVLRVQSYGSESL
jgi:hypothetical protein